MPVGKAAWHDTSALGENREIKVLLSLKRSMILQ